MDYKDPDYSHGIIRLGNYCKLYGSHSILKEMNISDLKQKIKKNDRLKRTVHYLIMNQRGSCPRLWVKWFVNPFMLTYGKRSKIRRSAIMNVSPINSFILGQESIIEHYVTIDNGVATYTSVIIHA